LSDVKGQGLHVWGDTKDRGAAGQAALSPAAIISLTSVAIASAGIVVLELLWPHHVVDPSARGSIETAITLAAMASTGLLVAQVIRHRRVRDLLLLAALATVSVGNFCFLALPALVGVRTLSLGQGTPAQLLWQSFVAVAFLGAASVPHEAVLGPKRRPLLIAGMISLGSLGVVTLLTVVAHPHNHAAISGSAAGLKRAADHPVACALALAYATALLIAAVRFLRRAREDHIAGLLAAVVIALAGVRLHYLALPVVGFGWVTPGDGLRAGAYALLLFALLTRWAYERRDSQRAAISAERQRIAHDLHDGLAQDLAYIAMHGQRFASELGPEHPLALAAERALAAARGTIVDLSASAATSTEDALERVASELETRFNVAVEVQVGPGPAELEGADREHVVRIVREAIVNAIRHGGAHRIRVVLDPDPTVMRLTVSDDGRGFDEAAPVPEPGHGFGLAAMQTRAASLGGRLVARPGATGGTELELLVS
jgi:signal transduction histidine kinase